MQCYVAAAGKTSQIWESLLSSITISGYFSSNVPINIDSVANNSLNGEWSHFVEEILFQLFEYGLAVHPVHMIRLCTI